ncbi:hypothetical protein C0J52_22377 [Blattella germanica]|nr:hypothetical protein C0J52_22377 [Blattella germanica]
MYMCNIENNSTKMSEDRNESTKRDISRRQFVLGDYIKVTKNIKKNKNVLTQGEDALVKQNARPNNNISFEADSKIGNKYVPPHRRLQYAANRETKTTFESKPGNRDVFKFERRECQKSDSEYFSKRESKGDPERPNNPRGRTFGSNNTSCTKTEGLTKYHPSVCKSPEYKGLNELIWFQNLSTMQPTEVLLTIASRRLEIEKMFTNTLSSELLDVFLKFLVKLCQTDFTLNETCIAVLSCSCQEHFLDQLSKHVLYLVASRKMVENVNQMLNDYIFYMETIMSLFPQKISNTLEQIVTVNDMLMQFYESYDVLHCDTRIKEKFQSIKDHCQKQKMSQKKLEKEKSRNVDNVIEFNTEIINSEEFRKINIFPEIDDILGKRKYLIKPNIVNGAYDNVEHYLSIQFHLLREDFYSPLREGISEYLTSEIKLSRVNNVRIFRNVTFLMPIILRTQIGYLINFGSNLRMSKMTWEDSKWFVYGSLLLFTSDNFNTVIFGTVIDSNDALLEKGLLIVSLKDIEIHDALFNREFLLMESETYFEPYLHVLKALQSLNENNFPMEKYVVHVKTDISPPKYLCENRSVRMEIDEYEFSVLDDSSWPSPEDLKLDSSQHNALRNALTRELAVIQGPPGTGKTFLGLKVAQVLIRNSEIWNSNNQPILVVCYTNHALDQFISGLIRVTNHIVRIGAQSKNKELENLNLKLKCKRYRRTDGTYVLLQALYNVRWELIEVMEKVNNFLVKITQHKGIVSYASLKKYGIVKNDNNYFDTCYKFTEELFIEWLSYGMHDDTSMCEEQKIRSKNIPDEVWKLQNMETSKSDSCIFWKMLFRNIDVSDKYEYYKIYHIPCFCTNRSDHEYELEEYSIHYEAKEFDMCSFCRRKRNIFRNVHYLKDTKCELYDNLLYAIHLKEFIDDDKPSELAYDIDIHESRLRMMEDEIYQFQKKNVSEKVSRLKMHADAMKSQIKYIKKQLHHEEVLDNDVDAINRMLKRGNLLDLQAKERWTVYRYWEKNLKVRLLEELYRWEKHLQEINRLYDKTELIREMSTMKSSLVVGMTTTGAARLQNVIKNLQPAIGDHKQLRPSPAEYKLARDYNFDISLFERMINNGIPCDMLKLQHRMRPEISQLITPTIYPGLQNHSSIEDSHSIRNIPEGDLVLGLCCYLVQQGEQASKITILATYAGQMFYLQKEQKKYSILQNVQITVVDNFQGEENDIILLSLVRSNKDANIGFLKTENRVCVALSRARKGLYMFGNMNNLTKSSTIWPKIKEILESQEAIDSSITLRCQLHVSEFTKIRSLTDFSKVPNGCCTLICDDDLKCGHKCKQSCHLVDRKHENYNDECWKTKNCMALVDTILPLCGHEVKKPCYLKPEEFICTEPCEYRPLCGHSCYQCKKSCANFNKNCKEGHKCEKMCFEKCDNCAVLVQRTLSVCGHEAHIPCAEDPESYICKANCERILPCGHPCPLLCYENCGGCPVQVTVQLTDCQHTLEVKCCEKDNIDCLKPCEKKLLCGHTCAGLCSEACTKMCMELVVSTVTPICGHVIEIPCYLQSEVFPESESILSRCQMPCEAILDCEHQCRGTCVGCRQGKVHQSCDERCEKILVCGHRCKLRCSDTCQPCTNRCLNSCEHMTCSRECGFPCIQCKHSSYLKEELFFIPNISVISLSLQIEQNGGHGSPQKPMQG